MGGKRGKKTQSVIPSSSAQSDRTLPTTTSAVRDDPKLGYKLRVLVYDLLNISKNPDSEKRLNSTTDEYYFSKPYFTLEESEAVKNALIDTEPSLHFVPGTTSNDESDLTLVSRTIQDALGLYFSNFLDKRRASGDSRPCGPHHLAPLYAGLYGINLRDLQDPGFLSRLRKAGI